MKNNFAQEYAKHVELMNTYKTLKQIGDTAAIEELRNVVPADLAKAARLPNFSMILPVSLL